MLKSTYLRITVAACIAVAALTFFSFRPEGPIDQLLLAINNWVDKSPQEKVYLHTNQPYYAVGDTVYFKAYLTSGSRHKLSGLSGTLYVDLIDEKNKLEKSIMIPITVGMGRGSFVLEDAMGDGNYRLRAYTEWMRNAGPDYFYDHTFSVVKVKGDILTRISYNYTTGAKPELQATINYTDATGAPVAGRDVKAEIKNGDKITIKRLKTDATGNIIVPLNGDKATGFARTSLLTTLERKDKTEFVKAFAIKAGAAQTDVQFFPESGSLVNGLLSRVGFKAVGMDGLGVNIKGTIFDNTNAEVTTFESTHAGMGRFNFMPEAGKTYTAKFNLPDGSTSTVDLPKAAEDGYVLSVYNNLPNDTVLVRISASAGLLKTPQTVSLVAQSGGEVFSAAPVKINKPMTILRIPQKPFPSGVAQFTLFNETNQPLNERIAFMRNKDQMQLTVNTAKQTYKTREKVQIDVDAKDRDGKPVIGAYSVSVNSEAHIPVNENTESTILSTILLTSDIKGYVETPNYYFATQSKEVDKDLDDLMLTQGYRRFVWKDLLAGKLAINEYKVEKYATEISGKLLTLSNKPLAGGKVLLFSLEKNVALDTVSDENGNFRFKILLPAGIKFNVQGRTAQNSNKVQVVLDKQTSQSVTSNKNLADVNGDLYGTNKEFIAGKKQDSEILQKFGSLNEVQQLGQVNIKAKKPRQFNSQGMFAIPEGSADQVLVFDDNDNCGTLFMCLQARLQGVFFRPREGYGSWPYTRNEAMNVIIDGRRLEIGEASDVLSNNGLTPSEILKIEVVRTSTVQMSMIGGPSLLITTKRGFSRPSNDPSITYVSPRGFSQVKEFYAPRYDKENDKSIPDVRAAIYWNDNVKTGEDGKGKFDFYNSDTKGKYRVTIEGINAAGELGRQVYFYTVE